YNKVKVDGTIGPITEAAIIEFQKERNIEQTGKLDKNTIIEIERRIYEIKEYQNKLNYLGFNDVKVDGSLGPITETAIIEFQKERNIEQTGKLDENTILETDNVIGDYQTKLGLLNFRNVKTNKNIDSQTQYAILRFQTERRIPNTGKFDAKTRIEIDRISNKFIYSSSNKSKGWHKIHINNADQGTIKRLSALIDDFLKDGGNEEINFDYDAPKVEYSFNNTSLDIFVLNNEKKLHGFISDQLIRLALSNFVITIGLDNSGGIVGDIHKKGSKISRKVNISENKFILFFEILLQKFEYGFVSLTKRVLINTLYLRNFENQIKLINKYPRIFGKILKTSIGDEVGNSVLAVSDEEDGIINVDWSRIFPNNLVVKIGSSKYEDNIRKTLENMNSPFNFDNDVAIFDGIPETKEQLKELTIDGKWDGKRGWKNVKETYQNVKEIINLRKGNKQELIETIKNSKIVIFNGHYSGEEGKGIELLNSQGKKEELTIEEIEKMKLDGKIILSLSCLSGSNKDGKSIAKAFLKAGASLAIAPEREIDAEKVFDFLLELKKNLGEENTLEKALEESIKKVNINSELNSDFYLLLNKYVINEKYFIKIGYKFV
ncbi:MAG: peptidoglycan-binding protein, partial [Nanoarchaeota archaeon]|nr:peptidoglycan-binding protein [Nanoarchaeota archaeon]